MLGWLNYLLRLAYTTNSECHQRLSCLVLLHILLSFFMSFGELAGMLITNRFSSAIVHPNGISLPMG